MRKTIVNVLIITVLLVMGNLFSASAQCETPDAIEITTTENTATFYWDDYNEPATWRLIVSPSLINQPSVAQAVTVTSVPYTVTGLQPQTQYYYRLQSVCSDNTESEWTDNYLYFRTACAPVTALPYTEDFSGNVFPPCWTRYSDNYPTVSDGQLLFLRNCQAVLPYITADISTLQISFDAMSQSAPASLAIGVIEDLDDPDNFFEIQEVTVTSAMSLTHFTVVLSDYTESGHYISLRFGSNTRFFVSNVEVATASNCQQPADLAATSITANSATLSWTESGSATQWRVAVSPTAVADPSTCNPQTVNNRNFTASQLSPNTTYYFYVQALCGSESSNWTASSFTTPCATVLLPASESFTYGGLPDCWSAQQVSGSSQISVIFDWLNPTVEAYAGSGMVRFNSSMANNASTRLVTMPFSTISASELDVNFMWFHTPDHPEATNEGVILQYSFDGNTWANSSQGLIQRYSSVYDGWTEYDVIIPEVGGRSQVYIGFLFVAGLGQDCFMDEVSLSAGTGCYKPAGIAVSNVQGNSAQISWTEVGSANAWQLVVSPTPITNFANANIINTTTPSYTATSLNPQTTYYVYVRSACNATTHSAWSAPVTFTTTCGAILQFPYYEGFDDYGTCSDAFPECWSRPRTFHFFDENEQQTCNTPSASAAAHYSGGKSLLFCSASNDFTYAITPAIGEDIRNVSIIFFLNFMDVTYSGTMEVGFMSNPNDYATFHSVATITPQQANTWTCHPVSFADVTADIPVNNHIAFRHHGTTDMYGCYLDNVMIQYAADCWDAVNPQVSNITGNTATISWTDINEQPVDWHLKISDSPMSDCTLPANVLDTVISGTSFTINYLVGNTIYYYYIASDCGNSQLSNWNGGHFETELCNCYVTLYMSNVLSTSDWHNSWIEVRQNGELLGRCTVPDGTEQASFSFYTCTATPVSYTYVAGTNAHETGFTFYIMDSEGNRLYTHLVDQTLQPGVFMTSTPACGANCSTAPTLTSSYTAPTIVSLSWNAITDAQSYALYRDNQLIANYITATSYTDHVADNGDHCYTVAPICITGEGTLSAPSCVADVNDYTIANSVKIYPNPAKDKLQIEASNVISNILVVNMLGQTCLTQEVNATQTSISLSSLENGMYLLKIWDGTSWNITKFIVQK